MLRLIVRQGINAGKGFSSKWYLLLGNLRYCVINGSIMHTAGGEGFVGLVNH